MVNPFDLKSALLAKHAQHVVLIHFPIALCLTATAFDFLAWWKQRGTLAAVAYYNLLVAALMTIPVSVTGILAWQWQLEGQGLKGNLLLHLSLGLAATAMIWLVWWLHVLERRRSEGPPPKYILAVELVAACVVALTAHVGGILSGVSLPN